MTTNEMTYKIIMVLKSTTYLRAFFVFRLLFLEVTDTFLNNESNKSSGHHLLEDIQSELPPLIKVG